MKEAIIPIRGMHCRSCELLVEDELKSLPEIKKVKVSLSQKKAVVKYQGKLDMEKVGQAVTRAGYAVGSEDQLPWLTANQQQLNELVVALAGFFFLYMVWQGSGLKGGNWGFSGEPTSLVVVLMIGLMAGVSTCMALVGGLVLGVASRHAERHPEASPAEKFRPHLFFNLGRIGGYFILGGLIGLVGQAFELSGNIIGLLTVMVGGVMLLLGAQLTQLSPRLSSWSLSLPAHLSKVMGVKGREQREYSHRNAAITGALTFFLPCGFTQAMQLYAMTSGSFLAGALVMGVFAIGTAPGLLGIGGLTAALRGLAAQRLFRVVGLVVIVLAIFNISNGLNLLGITGIPRAIKETNQGGVPVQAGIEEEDGVQVVRMKQLWDGYEPNSFTIKAGVPVRWVITSEAAGSCASSIYSQKLGIRRNLKQGENVIEFTAKEPGQIRFSCSMGMYTGVFNVVGS